MIFEIVITTLNEDMSCHIAPMGIRFENQHYIIAPFKPSTTLENIRRSGAAVINMTDDVRIFAGCLTGRRDWPLKSAEQIEGMVLENALAHIEVRVQQSEDDKLRPRFYCKAVHEQQHSGFHGFNRAQAAVVEAAILVSRLHMLPREKVESELAYLSIAVEKTAGENEQQAWQWLQDVITEHYAKNEGVST